MAESESHVSEQPRWTRLWTAYRAVLPAILRHPATWLFAVVYLLAALIYLPIGGNLLLFSGHLIFFGVALIILLLIVPLTAGAPSPAWENEPSYPHSRLWWQIVALFFLYMLFIAFAFVVFFLMASFIRVAQSDLTGRLLLSFGVGVLNMLILAVLPVWVMRLMGVSWQEIGLGRGYHVWRVIAVSCAVPLVLSVVFIFLGRMTLPIWLLRVVTDALQAGVPEEVFFRGILQTRLTRLAGTGWAIVLSSLIFGLIHVATNLASMRGNVLLALAETIVGQATLGLAFAVIFQRTRNILAGMVFHTAINSMGI